MNENPAGRILIVDSAYETLELLARTLRSRGHQVAVATDGRGGLQAAVEVSAEIVLVDRDMPILDVRTFLEVLRDNPRTSSAHAFVIGTGDPARLATFDGRAEPIVRPFNAEEVAARVEEVLRARRAPSKEPELRGDLAQVALFDLLQVFAANRRTGQLRVETGRIDAEVWLKDGAIVDARYGAALGEKALFRVLSITRGKFAFLPHLTTPMRRIVGTTEELLMEGVRHADEIVRLHDELPSLSAQVQLATTPPPDLSSTAAELVDCLDETRAIEELLDAIQANDLEVLQAVRELLEANVLLVIEPEGDEARISEDDDGAIAMRAAAVRLRRPGLEGRPRIVAITTSVAEAGRFARALARVREFVPAGQPAVPAGQGGFGSLGAIRIGGADVELFALPLDVTMRPLWNPVLAPAKIALALAEEPIGDDLIELLRSLDVKLVRAATPWDKPAGAASILRAALGEAQAATGTLKAPPS